MHIRILSLGLIISNLFIYSELSAQKLVEGFEMPTPLTSATVSSLKVTSNDKIVVAGDIDFYSDKAQPNMVRLNADGSLDEGFNFNSEVSISQTEFLSTGEIVAIGANYLYKISSLGEIIDSLDIGYSGHVRVKDDKIFVASNKLGLNKYNASLKLDDTFNNDNIFSGGSVRTLAFQGDDILVGGSFSQVNNTQQNDIARFNENGFYDQTFDTGTGTDDYIGSLVVQGDGKILLSGSFINSYNGVNTDGLVRLNSDGSLDFDFTPPMLNGPVHDTKVLGGKILISTSYYDGGTTSDLVMRLNNDGTIDGTFNLVYGNFENIEPTLDGFLVSSKGGKMGIEKYTPDGLPVTEFDAKLYKFGFFEHASYYNDFIIVIGDFIKLNGVETLQIGKINLNGDVNPDFIVTSEVNIGSTTNNRPIRVKIKGDDEIYISLGKRLLKLDRNGNPVDGFDTPDEVIRPSGYTDPSYVDYFEFLQNGQITTAGANGVYLLNENGSQDTNFAFENTSWMNSTSFGFGTQSTGNIIYGSFFNEINDVSVNRLVRVGSDGNIDETFDMGEGPGSTVEYINILPNDEILVSTSSFNGMQSNLGLFKLDVDGTLNTEFTDNINSTLTESMYLHDAVVYKNTSLIFSYINFWTFEQRLGRMGLDGNIEEFILPDNISIQPFNGRGMVTPIAVEDDKLLLLGDFVLEDGSFRAGVMLTHNMVPVVVKATSPISVQEESSVLISIDDIVVRDLDNLFPDDFLLTVWSGDNYTLNNNEVTPDKDFNGILQVRLAVSDGLAISDIFELHIEVTAVNDIPVIKGMAAVKTASEGVPVTVSPSDFIIEDPDNVFPDDFSLAVMDGENYEVDVNQITPATGFNGRLIIPVTINDGIDESEIYNMELKVLQVTGLGKEDYSEFRVYPNPFEDKVTIKPTDLSRDVDMTIFNARGEVVYSIDKQKSIDIGSLSSGVYILQIKSEDKVQTIKLLKK